jgi:hypothetical protein
MLTPATEPQIGHRHQARDPSAGSGQARTFAVEADPLNERIWAGEPRHVFGRAIRLHHARDEISPESFARRRTLIENASPELARDRLVFDRAACPERSEWVAPKTEAARLQKRYRTPRASLYVFLERTACPERSERVEPTNTGSERDLRPSVSHRKVIGGFRSGWGAEASAIRTSLLATARKQGHNLLDACLAIAGPSPLQAIPART